MTDLARNQPITEDDQNDHSGQLTHACEPDALGTLLIDESGALPVNIISTEEMQSPAYSPLSVRQAETPIPAPVVASCPHAGRDYPAELVDAASLPVAHMRGLEDFAVDQLLGGLSQHGIATVINHIARAYIDVNRPAGALDNAMFDTPVDADKPSRHVSAGYGLIPRLSAMRKPLYSASLPSEEAERRINVAHLPYHSMLMAQISAAKAEHGHCLLVDFHSMPPRDRTNRKLADVVLGDCLGSTLDTGLANSIGDFFRDAGLSIAWNEPYAGGHITRTHGRLGTKKQSVQIEINRDIYMQDAALSAREPFVNVANAQELHSVIGRFGAYLVEMRSN